jgi:hypothetical protein
LAGAGWERELTGGAHASARGEREGAEDGMTGLRTRWAGAMAWAGWAHFYRKDSKGFDFRI